MQMLGRLIVGIVLLQAGCGDDDNGHGTGNGNIDAAVGATTFSSTLTTAAEVPVCAPASASAAGAANVELAADESSVIVENVTFSGLSGPATAAHIHTGAPGVAGPITIDFGADPTSPITMTVTAATYPSPPPAGAPPDFAAFIRELEAGNTYVNVHTAACPPGEIRGQLQQQ